MSAFRDLKNGKVPRMQSHFFERQLLAHTVIC